MYEIGKILHLSAMIVWMAGMVMAPIRIIEVSKLEERRLAARALCFWYLRVFSPAMIILWITGLYIMTSGGWFDQTWMMAKLGLVVFLSGLHGALSGQMRRMSTEEEFEPSSALFNTWLVMLVVLVAVISAAVLKF